jgi:hypothetical protein
LFEGEGSVRPILGVEVDAVTIRPLPEGVERWVARARRLRWADAGVGWLVFCGFLWWPPWRGTMTQTAAVALGLTILASLLRPLRAVWRPVSAWVGVVVSRDLHAGDRAWYVRSERADLVLVTARHGIRMVIVTPDIDADEGLSVRRTRVLLLPADRG